ncbi:MAG: TolC family protein [Gemmatimonadota bacterium]|nr:MAG: TolC family protein [Gemmatimonadota bacterium]
MRTRLIIRAAVVTALATPAAGASLTAQAQSVTLEEAIEMALRSQPAMIQAHGQVSNANSAKLQAVGAWLPSLSASSGFSSNSSTRYDQATQRTVLGSSTSYSSGISASLTVFDGLSRMYDNRVASADAAAADATLINQEFQTTLQTKQTFFNALAAEELVRVSESQIVRSLEQHEISKEKLAAGTATRSDTLRSSVDLANARLQKLNAEAQLANGEAALARLIGIDGSAKAVREDALLVMVDIDTTTLRDEALQQSPTIYQAEAAVRAADATVSASYGTYFPRISASYSRSWSGSEVLELNPSWSARLSASWTLFNGFAREASKSRAQVSRDNARAQAEDARRDVNTQLTQYLTALAQARAQHEIAAGNIAAGQEDLRVQRERYRLGAATLVEVLVAQASLDSAEVSVVQARLDYLVTKAQIEALIGREL